MPAGKEGQLVCLSCQKVKAERDLSDDMKEQLTELKHRSKAPLWMFSGLGLILIAIAFNVYRDHKRDEQTNQLVLNPQVGDVYEIKDSITVFTLYKVMEVDKDTVWIVENQYQASAADGLDDLQIKDYYKDEEWFTRQELQEMVKNKKIIGVHRKGY